jgi:hypothetical protein
MKTGGRLVKHARYYWLLLAEGHLTRSLSERFRVGYCAVGASGVTGLLVAANMGGLRGGMEVVSEKSANAAMPGVRDPGRTRMSFHRGLPGNGRTTGRARVFRRKEFGEQNGNSSHTQA